MAYPEGKEDHRLDKQMYRIRQQVDEVMPHVERIEEVVQQHPDLFGAVAGQLKIKAAATFLERYAKEYANK